MDTDKDTDKTCTTLPLTEGGIEAFLSGPKVEGIGPVYARKLVERYGCEALTVLRDRPEEAREVKGVPEPSIIRASESLKKLRSPELYAFLYSSGLGKGFADRIVGKYGKRAIGVVSTDPYSMVEDVWQLGFGTADKIGRALGICAEDSRRLRGALLSGVKHAAEEGHLFALPEQATAYAVKLTGCSPEKAAEQIGSLIKDGRLVRSRGGLYLPVYYKAEKEGAQKLLELAEQRPKRQIEDKDIPTDDGQGRTYSPMQRQAIKMVLNSPVSVLTGGPGSGKTTILRAIISRLKEEGKKVVLAAPTGRAAKRMSMLTGEEASTIHRLLGYLPGEGYRRLRGEGIDADVLIIDEGSMLEQVLFDHLLQGLRPGTQLILAGDADQLPAIGAGDVLRDLIEAGAAVSVARLNENFRQAVGSGIAEAAKAINSGKVPESHSERGDFEIVEANSPREVHDQLIKLICEELPRKHGIDPIDLTVVTPQQVGPLGARQLNKELQAALNPEGPEVKRGETIFRLGDPVQQRSNSRARGVYNGEHGIITRVEPEEGKIEVEFEPGHRSTYGRKELGELQLAYATTVHKLQGSEVKNVVMPVTMAHKPMLYRNLLYTAVSRAGDRCVLLAEPEALELAVDTTPAVKRNSNFRHRLRQRRRNRE